MTISPCGINIILICSFVVLQFMTATGVKDSSAPDVIQCCQQGKDAALGSLDIDDRNTCILQGKEEGEEEEDGDMEQTCSSTFYQCCRSQQRTMACQKGREAPLLVQNINKSCFRLFKGSGMVNVMKECCICCKMGLSGSQGRMDVTDVLCHESMKQCSAIKGRVSSSTMETLTSHYGSTSRMTSKPTPTAMSTPVSTQSDKSQRISSTQPLSTLQQTRTTIPENTIEQDKELSESTESTLETVELVQNDDSLQDETEVPLLSEKVETLTSSPIPLKVTHVKPSTLPTSPVMPSVSSKRSPTSNSFSPSRQPQTDSLIVTSSSSTPIGSTASTPAPIVCPDESFQWNPQKLFCERILMSCPKGFIMDKALGICRIPTGPIKECPKGYQLNTETWKCEDINECAAITSPCQHEQTACTNTPGSYYCSCERGYQLTVDRKCEDIDECTLHPTPCTIGKDCFNTRGSFECRRTMPCGFGYSLDMETQECVDIDECKSDANVCGPGMQCVNVRGGHKCEEVKCPPGLWRNSGGKCSLCKEGYNYNNRTHLCEDINECELPHMSRLCRPFENCVNRPGTFDCILKLICRKGTRLSPNGTHCEDINECQERYFECAEDEICVNEFGSYSCKSSPCLPSQIYDYTYKQCTCKTGFRLNEYEGCQDINECEDNPCGDNKQCINLIGSYSCYAKNACPQGMYRPNSLSACVDLDECINGEARCPVNMDCINTIGSYTCTCRKGYKKEKDECVDINDCIVYPKEMTCPDPVSTCVNTIGTYMCSCPAGYVWQDQPQRKCEDLDECQKDQGICGQGHKCINLVGSYRCQCARGYAIASNGKSCKDVDECSLRPRGRPTCPNGRCFNFPGGYQCQCPPGYRLGSGNRCEDIDECRESLSACAMNPYNRNQKSCINLKGSHKCVVNTCPPGYAKSYLGNGMKCKLDAFWHCEVGDGQCHRDRPYRLSYHFIELSTDVSTPHTIVRVDHSHLPTGNKRMSLLPKYAINTLTNKPINTDWLFQIDPSQTEGSVDIRLIGPLDFPAELLLELNLEVYHSHLFIGKSTAMIYLYVTRYPDDFSKDDQ